MLQANLGGEGVDKRADQLLNEYMDKARRMGRLYCETEPGEVNQIEATLLCYKRVRSSKDQINFV